LASLSGDPLELNQKSKSYPNALRRGWHGFLAGIYAGVLFSALSFVLYGSASAPYLFGTWHALQSYAYTIAIYSVSAGVVGLLLGLVLWALSFAIRPLRGRPFWVLLILPFSTLIPFLFANARWQIDLPRNVALFDSHRIEFLQSSLLICLAAGLVVSIVLTFAFHGRSCWRMARLPHAVLAIAAPGLVVVTLAGMHLTHGRIEWDRVQNVAEGPSSDQHVLFVGLDGATWSVLAPMLDKGMLPNMKEFRDRSAYGPLQVYGKAFSPSVWTTMATGVKRSVHGIVSYTVSGNEGNYLAGSSHRKVPAIWNIVNQAGLYAGMINYMVAFPPEHITGINLTRMVPVGAIPYEEKVWPHELIPRVSAVVDAVPQAEGADEHARDLNHELHVLTDLLKAFYDPSFSFFTLYTHSTDDCEHRYWSYMFPEDFSGSLLEPSAADVAAKRNVIENHWREVDHLFEFLNTLADRNTSVIVVSDHGMESAAAPETHLAVNKLLEGLGLLAFTADAKIDSARTLAYWPSGSDVNMGATGIQINRNAIDRFFENGATYEEARAHVIKRLRSVRLTGADEPLLPVVRRSEEEDDPAYREPLERSDIIVHLSAYTRGARVNDMVTLGDRTAPIADILRIKDDVTGAHHPRGIIMARGLPFKVGPVFNRPTVETPVSDVCQRVLGRVERLDGLMSAAQFFGIVDRATTLDLAQTMLYLLGIPCADYMQGRVLEEGLDGDYISEHRGAMIADYGAAAARADDEGAPSPEELERLRSLGYVD
jgi:predicted AlkP superfamily phosphohydrolase/phosphomutase